MLEANGRVPLDYEQTNLTDHVAHYASQMSDPAAARYPTNLHIALLLPGTRYHWEPVRARRVKDEGFKLIDLAEPVVSLSPLHLSWGNDRKLHFALETREQAWIGLSMSFPKVVFYDSEGFETPHGTEETRNAALFDLLCGKIRGITKPALFETPAGERNGNLRVSPAGVRSLGSHPRLVAQGIQLLRPSPA